jgi:8-oxo-dGTP pyrophosphatase MutT (NUDIX family)
MESTPIIKIKCRGIILHKGKLLLAKHRGTNYYALPGGKLEWPENPKECLEREIEEEFGVKPQIGKLLYINNYGDGIHAFIEFFFEVKNWADYRDIEKLSGAYRTELLDVLWVDKNTNLEILPEKFCRDFKENKILFSGLKFIR